MKITLLQNKLITFTLQLYAFINFRIKKDQKFQSRHPSERTVCQADYVLVSWNALPKSLLC